MKKFAVTCTLVLLGVFLFWGEASAQPGVPSGPRRVLGQQELQFGTVLAGMPTTVALTDANAGIWRIWGNKNTEIQLTFVNLPTALQSGTLNLPISFSSNDAAYSDRFNGGALIIFDPNVGVIARLGNSGKMSVRIGGTVTPPPNQQPGNYVADIDLDVIYTGN